MSLRNAIRTLALLATIAVVMASCGSSSSSLASIDATASTPESDVAATAESEPASEPTASEPTASESTASTAESNADTATDATEPEPEVADEAMPGPSPTPDLEEVVSAILPDFERGAITLLDAGEDPQPLRYELDGDVSVRTLQTTTQQFVQISDEVETSNEVTTGVETTTTLEGADGDGWILMTTIDDGTVEGSDPDTVARTRPLIEAQIGTVSRLKLEPNGAVTALLSDAEASDPGLAQQSQLAAEQLATIFPDEPIGVGGSWQVVTDIESLGLSLTQVATTTVVSIDGDLVTLDASIEQTPTGAMNLGPAELIEFDFAARIDGTSIIDLSTSSVISDVTTESKLAMEIIDDGVNSKFDQTTTSHSVSSIIE